MNTTTTSLPKWILILSTLFAVMEIGVSVSLCLSPEVTLETVDLTAKGVMYLVYMWAARQFALGIIFAYATWKRSVPMLKLAYIFFLVMFLGDMAIGFLQQEVGMIISAIVMSIISGFLIYILNKKSQE